MSFACAPLNTCQAESLPVEELRVAFSPRGDALQEILSALRNARESVDVAMFYLSHEDLIDALCFLSLRQRVPVRVFTDVGAIGPADRHVLDRLACHGVQVYVVKLAGGKMHLKTAVVDERIVITGAANWTPQAFELSVEDTLLIRSPPLARQYRQRLDEIQEQSTPYEENSDVRGMVLQRRFPAPSRSRAFARNALTAPRVVSVGPIRHAEVFFSPGREGARRLAAQIQAATSRVEIALYLLSDTDLLQVLVQKGREGDVKLRLRTDVEMLAGNSRPLLQELAEGGFQISWWDQERSSLHLKAAVIDGRYVWTGSANWTVCGLDRNHEDMVFFDSPVLAGVYERFFRALEPHLNAFQPIGEIPDGDASAARRTADGYLVGLPPTGPRTDWQNALRDTPFPAFDTTASVRYVPDAEYFPLLLDLIKTARQSLLISMYVMPEPKPKEPCREQLVAALAAAAQRGVYVYLLLNMPDNEALAAGRAHEDWAERLRAKGMDIRLNLPAMPHHDKLVVADLAKVLVGSHNWTEGALSGERVYESSALLVLERQELRLADYVFSRQVVQDMRSRAHWEEELRRLRLLAGLRSAEREAFLNRLEAETVP